MESQTEVIEDIVKKLQNHYDSLLGVSSISIGIGNDTIYLYEHTCVTNRELPEWAKLDGVNFKFEYIGKVQAF